MEGPRSRSALPALPWTLRCIMEQRHGWSTAPMRTDAELVRHMIQIIPATNWQYFHCSTHLDASWHQVVETFTVIDVDKLVADQRATLNAKKALQALKKGLQHWKGSARRRSAARPRAAGAARAVARAALPVPSERLPPARRATRVTLVAKPKAKAAAKAAAKAPARPTGGAIGGAGSDDDAPDGLADALGVQDVIDLSSDDGGMDDATRDEWLSLSDAVARREAMGLEPDPPRALEGGRRPSRIRDATTTDTSSCQIDPWRSDVLCI